MKKTIFFTLIVFFCIGHLWAQNSSKLTVIIETENNIRIDGANVALLNSDGKTTVKQTTSNKNGTAIFENIVPAKYQVKAALMGFTTSQNDIDFPAATSIKITLKPETKTLNEVTVNAKLPVVQRSNGKTVVNVDASPTNAGTTVLDVLEKSPGVMVDRNGGLGLQGKASILVLIDDKPTYLSGSELNNLLNTMSSSQVSQIELITNPSAKYDANGNAGIINIKTKKNRQEGFNGTLQSNLGHGKYIKSNNALLLNYRKNKINTFLNYSYGYNKNFTSIYAYRKYFDTQGDIISALDQPSYLGNIGENNSAKLGIDFYANNDLTVGLTFSGILVDRNGDSEATATWQNSAQQIDSAITTLSTSDFSMKNGSVNLYSRYKIGKTQELGFDIDYLKYDIDNFQFFNNIRTGSIAYNQGSKGNIPSSLNIFSAKADYSTQLGKTAKFEAGLKSSNIKTNNLADYQLFDGTNYTTDLNKSNHFIYEENISSAYTSIENKTKKWSYQLGLRYEYTDYVANQLGNPIKPAQKFNRHYHSLFPSGFLTHQLDSLNVLSFSASRRIDRPPYQKLNPFVFIINKYTYQKGNPFFLPQYNWNFELGHSYKQLLHTSVSYSNIKNYFSQLFLSEGEDILIYTDGNVGQMHNFGVSVTLQVAPIKWWSLMLQSNFNYKKLSGYNDINYRSSVKQLHSSMNNQFKISKTLNGEVSGFYTTKARNDLQEILSPTGQLSAGLAQTILKGKGTLRLTARDIFYTQKMEGVTDFPDASEYFILWRDSQVLTFGFSYRFGKPLKATKRSSGGAADEMNRAGT